MLTTLPVVGVAYLIRLYSGRTHWAVATLYGLLAWGCTFALLVEFTGAETPLNMSITSSVIGAGILALPGEWMPGIEEENESGVEDGNVNESGTASGAEDKNDGQGKNHGDSTDQNTPPLSDLPELKSELEETHQLLDQLREQKGEASPERYDRLRQQYREEIKRLKSEIRRLREQGTSRKNELEERLSQQQNRQEDIEAELEEIETLYEEGAMRESTYQEERSQLREELENKKEKASQIEQEIGEVDLYLSETEEVSDPETRTQKVSRRKEGQGQQATKTEEKKVEQDKQTAFGSWQGRLAVIAAILLLPVIGYWSQKGGLSGSSEPQKINSETSTSETSTSETPPSETPASETPASQTVAMVGGGPGRTNVYAGPGPAAPIEWKWGIDLEGHRVPAGPPVINGGTAYLATDTNPFIPSSLRTSQYVAALDARTSQGQWVFQIDGTDAPPAVARETVYVGDNAGRVYALDAKTGQKQWHSEIGESVSTSPAVTEGTVYVGNSSGDIYALSAETGQRQWRFDTYTGILSSLAVVDSTVYVYGTDTGATGYVYALNAETGQRRWRSAFGKNVSASLAVSEGTVYIKTSSGMVESRVNHSNYIYALSANSGRKKWNFEADGNFFESMAVSEGKIYISSSGLESGFVYSVDAETGQQQWRFESPEDSGDLMIAGSSVYVEDGYRLYALDTVTGREKWSYRPRYPPTSLALDGESIYVTSIDSADVYALQ